MDTRTRPLGRHKQAVVVVVVEAMDSGCGSSQRGKSMKPELNCRAPSYYLDHIVVVVVVLLLLRFCHHRSDRTRPDHLLMHNLTRYRRCDIIFVWKSVGMRTYAKFCSSVSLWKTGRGRLERLLRTGPTEVPA